MVTSEPIAKKFGTVDCIREATPCAKCRANGELLSKCVKYNWSFFYLYILFLETHLQVTPLDGFSRVMSQTMQSHTRVCLLGLKNFILIFKRKEKCTKVATNGFWSSKFSNRRKSGHWIQCHCQNCGRKLDNRCFCAWTVKYGQKSTKKFWNSQNLNTFLGNWCRWEWWW